MQYALVLAGAYVVARNFFTDETEPANVEPSGNPFYYPTPDAPKICYDGVDGASYLKVLPSGRLCKMARLPRNLSHGCGGALSPQPPIEDLQARIEQQGHVGFCSYAL